MTLRLFGARVLDLLPCGGRIGRVSRLLQKIIRIVREAPKDPLLYFWVVPVVLLGILTFPPLNLLDNSKKTILVGSISSQTTVDFSAKGGESPFINQLNKSRVESPDFILVGGSSLQAATPPYLVIPQVLASLTDGYEAGDVSKLIIEYIVESGDTLWSLSERFNVSLSTILWANSLSQSSTLKLGQKLIIPPVSGVVHYVKAGETISDIAKKYKAKTDEILAFNELSSNADVYVGDVVIVPNGVMPAPAVAKAPIWVPLASSYFICPIMSPCRITQGLHWYNAIDFSHGQCGEPILAAAGGTVLKVKLTDSTSRWAFGGAGNHITIMHPNGAVTFYGHLATALVSQGEQVSQGQIIALMGGTPGTPGAGKSTACHLHFGVSGARNPFAR